MQKIPPTVNTLLHTSASALQQLTDKVKQLLNFTQMIHQVLPAEYAAHYQVANFDQQILTIAVDNSALATQIRYRVPDLIQILQQQEVFKDLQEIRCIIQPLEIHPSKKSRHLKLSKDNADLLSSVAHGIQDEKLKQSLEKLAKNK